MDKIKRILRVGTVVDDTFTEENSQFYVLFEDEAIAPLEVSEAERYDVLCEFAKQQGIDVVADPGKLDEFYEKAYNDDLIEQFDNADAEEMAAFNEELEAAKKKAEELGGKGKDPVPPAVIVENRVDPAKKGWGKRIVAAGLAAAALGGATYLLVDNLVNKNQDADQDKDKDIDFDTATFDEIMNSMDEDDVRRQVAERAMQVVTDFHNATHKEGNFRLAEDGEAYLDLSFEEALVLTTFANYGGDTEALYDILGSFEFDADEAQQTLESARTKIITYYMNATERSGLAGIFANPQDQMLFEQMEDSVLNFRSAHTTEASDQVLRNVYYNYILDSSTVAPNTSSMAKLLAFDTVYGGLILTETASVDHTQFLEFHGLGTEEETRKYVTDVLHLEYDSLSEEDKALYARNIIESGTQLVDLHKDGSTMTEENSTDVEREAKVSLTDLVDRTGLCNAVNDEISRAITAVSTTTEIDVIRARSLELNRTVADELRDAGYADLADQVELSLDNALSEDLLNTIRKTSQTAGATVAEYESDMQRIYGVNRPEMSQIADAAQVALDAKDNYAGYLDNISTLIQNRRHGVEIKNPSLTDEEKAAGIIGKTENGVPIVDADVFEGLTDEEKDKYVKENGAVIQEDDKVVTEEEVKYDDLTEDEKQQVEEQKVDITKYIEIENKMNYDLPTQVDAYAESYNYQFGVSTVTNKATDTPITYNIGDLDFVDAIVKIQAYGYADINSETGLYERNGNFSLDASSDAQILNAAEVAAENFLNSLSAEEQAIVAAKFGTSWEDARETLKTEYKNGYIEGVQNVVARAIAAGTQEYEVARAARETAVKKTQESKNEAILGDGNSVAEGEQTVVVEEGTPAVVEGESNTVGGGVQPNEEPGGNTGTTGNTDDEYDPNIDVAYGENEELVVDANGNNVRGAASSTSTSGVVVEEAVVTPSVTVTTDVNANVAPEVVIVEEVKAPTTTQSGVAADNTTLESQLAAAVAEALARNEEAENTMGARRR